MRTLMALLISFSFVGCGAPVVHHDTVPILVPQEVDHLAIMQEACQASAHITRRQRAIVIDGVSYYCF
jgi:hypothetical protein